MSQRTHPNRILAKQNGHLHYNAETSCSHNHEPIRWVCNGNCVECTRIQKLDHKLTPRYHETASRYQKEYQAKNRDVKRNKSILKDYGITSEQYEEMLLAQNHLCAICGQKETAKTRIGGIRALAIDHCHKSGIIRKLLCRDCNVGIGNLKHNPNLLRKAALYCEVW